MKDAYPSCSQEIEVLTYFTIHEVLVHWKSLNPQNTLALGILPEKFYSSGGGSTGSSSSRIVVVVVVVVAVVVIVVVSDRRESSRSGSPPAKADAEYPVYRRRKPSRSKKHGFPPQKNLAVAKNTA